MRKVLDANVSENIEMKNSSLIEILKNQHPVMYWWYALTAVSFCSVYIMVYSKF